jgi:hypothetical protein
LVTERETLAIHIRCYEKNHRDFHGVISAEYLTKAYRIISKLYDFKSILIFTDDRNEANEILLNTEIPANQIIDKNSFLSPAETILIMAKSMGFIGSNSSFSWWSAYLGDRMSRVSIFPRPWYKKNDTMYASQYQSNWITLGVDDWT